MISQIGFTYQPAAFTRTKAYRSVSSACFRLKQYFPGYIVDETALEGKVHTLPDVKTVLDGTTQGGGKLSDNLDIRNLKNSLDLLISLVSSGRFNLNKATFCNLHAKAACEEALVWGSFRTSGVSITGTAFKPPEAAKLVQVFDTGINYINALENPMERGVVFFLFGSMNQFFFDANKRVSRLMMNGALISAGYDALMIPASMRQEFNRQMLHFYNTRSAHQIIEFLIKCHALNAANLA